MSSLGSVVIIISTIIVPLLNATLTTQCYGKQYGDIYRDPSDLHGYFVCKSDFVSNKKCDFGYELNESYQKCEEDDNRILIRHRRDAEESTDLSESESDTSVTDSGETTVPSDSPSPSQGENSSSATDSTVTTSGEATAASDSPSQSTEGENSSSATDSTVTTSGETTVTPDTTTPSQSTGGETSSGPTDTTVTSSDETTVTSDTTTPSQSTEGETSSGPTDTTVTSSDETTVTSDTSDTTTPSQSTGGETSSGPTDTTVTSSGETTVTSDTTTPSQSTGGETSSGPTDTTVTSSGETTVTSDTTTPSQSSGGETSSGPTDTTVTSSGETTVTSDTTTPSQSTGGETSSGPTDTTVTSSGETTVTSDTTTPSQSTGGGSSSTPTDITTTENTPSSSIGPTSSSGHPCPTVPFQLDCTKLADGTVAVDNIDCSKFYYCKKGVTYSGRCSTGLWFDVEHNVCNFPAVVDCPSHGCKPIVTTTTETTSPTTVSSTTVQSTKTTSTTISTSSIGPTSASGHPCPAKPVELDCTDKADGVAAADTFDCNKFYYCRKGITHSSYCKNGLWYDAKHSRCAPSESVSCPFYGCPSTETTTSSTSSSTSTTVTGVTVPTLPPTSVSGYPCPAKPLELDCTGKPDGTAVADIFDCNKFHYCRKGIAHSSNCKNGLWYDANHNRCVPYGSISCPYYGCVSSETTTLSTSSSTSTPVTDATIPTLPPTSVSGHPCPAKPLELDCTGKPDGTAVADFFDCNKFFYCRKGIAHSSNCKNGQWYDADHSRCVPSGSISCPYYGCASSETTTLSTSSSTSTTTVTGVTIPTLPPTSVSGHPCPAQPPQLDCTGKPDGLAVADLFDCNKFYYCRKGITHSSNCKNGLWYDGNTNRCAARESVSCPFYGCNPNTTRTTIKSFTFG